MAAREYRERVPAPLPFLFDLDGTLADTIGDIAASTNHVRELAGQAPVPVETVRRCIGRGAATLLRRALPELGYGDSDPRWDALLAAYVAHHDVQCTDTARLYPGVLDHLRSLKARGHAIAIVTNKPERFAVVVARHLGLAEFVSVVVGGDTTAAKKPDPLPLREAFRRLSLPHDGPRLEGTMVGDGEPDLLAAKAVAMRTIACLYGYGDPTRLRAIGADAYWERFGG